MNYDIIGDIHGHADALEALLTSMGYQKRIDAWRHPDRQAIFVGDFIDRGPKQFESVNIVRRMVDAGSAQAIMGNHEFNAIAWFVPDKKQTGEYLRPHHSPKYGEKNFQQHKAFLDEVIGTPHHEEIIEWFLTLPLWLELDGIRVVHACWHSDHMRYLTKGKKPLLAEGNRLTEDLMVKACREPKNEEEKDTARSTVFKAVEALTKGIEIPLPESRFFIDKDGHKRHRVRTCWWDSDATSFQQAALLDEDERKKLPEGQIPDHVRLGHDGGKPIFIGHYWRTGEPRLLSNKVACVDYSIAKGGQLVAYRWNEEFPILDKDNFHWVGKQPRAR